MPEHQHSHSMPVGKAEAAIAEAPQIADPAPLGLAGFGLTTLVLSVINAGWISSTVKPGVLAMALTFGGLAQLLAGMWEFRRGNTFAATAFSSFGAFWLSFYLLVAIFIPQMKGATASDISGFVGLYLFAWGIFTAYMFIASAKSSRVVQVVFALLTLTFFILAVGEWATNENIGHIGGYAGLLTAVAALYGSFAGVVNANFKSHVMPTGG